MTEVSAKAAYEGTGVAFARAVEARLPAAPPPTPAERTHRPWPANAKPTPEQLAEWLSYALHHERLEFAERACRAMDESAACFLEDHRGRLSLLDLSPGRGRHRGE